MFSLILVENYLKNDRSYSSTNLCPSTDDWIPLETISLLIGLSSNYPFETITEALQTHPSSWIELSPSAPFCVRRRSSSDSNSRTVLVQGLPVDVTYHEIHEFFQSYSPVDRLIMLPSPKSFDGRVQVIFERLDDALTFVEQSKIEPVLYMKNHFSRFYTTHRLTCQMFNDIPKKEIRQSTVTPSLMTGKEDDQFGRMNSFSSGKSFSTRLARFSTRMNEPIFKENIGKRINSQTTILSLFSLMNR